MRFAIVSDVVDGFQRFRCFSLVEQGMGKFADRRNLLVLRIGFMKFVASHDEQFLCLRGRPSAMFNSAIDSRHSPTPS